MTGRAALLAAAAAACGSSGKPGPKPIEVPARRATVGDRILAHAPSGADAVLEIDLARLRKNRVVGPLVVALTAAGEVGGDLVAIGDAVVIASYRIGQTDAGQLVFVAGGRTGELRGGHRVDDTLVVFGPPALVRQVDAVGAGQGASLLADRALLRARALAMPAAAESASLRIAADLPFDARLALAKRLEVEIVPEWISVWFDVADDMAGVALLGGGPDADPQDLVNAVARLRDRLAAADSVQRVGLDQLVENVGVQVVGPDARVVLVIGPRRLQSLVATVMHRIQKAGGKQP
ncbi:MAG TPA: hypothetical protein VFU21_22840 [Kofleriaceae bacterium]|nr:hypothetical protein [Kofleriaceae bacterium]